MAGISQLRILAGWKRYVELVWRAIREVLPSAKAYLVGGAAESRLTLASDIDIVIVVPYEPGFQEAAELRSMILERAEELGLPLYAPVELHIVGPAALERYRRKGRLISLDELLGERELGM